MANGTKQKPGATFDLLWTNTNIHAAFPAQTISLDLSNYDAVLIKLTVNNTSQYESTTVEATAICFKGKAAASFNGIVNNQTFNMERVAIVSNSGIEFSTGYANAVAGDQYAVPLQIWGIKGIPT